MRDEEALHLHDRASRGEPLTDQEGVQLDAWYAAQDAAEAREITGLIPGYRSGSGRSDQITKERQMHIKTTYLIIATLGHLAIWAQMPLAQPTPVGNEFQVNTYTTYNQRRPHGATAGDGTFVVVWDSRDQDGSFYSVFGQRYEGRGATIGSEFQINTYTTDAQDCSAVAMAADGEFIVVWQSWQDGFFRGVYAQGYDNSGNPLGTEFQLNTYTTFSQDWPEIGMAGDGESVAVWTSGNQDVDVFGRRLDSAGNPVGSEFQINTYTTGAQLPVSMAMARDGRFIATWVDRVYLDGSSWGIFGQLYDSAGNQVGTEFQVNTYTTGMQSCPSVAMAPGGEFAVVWHSEDQDGSVNGVFGQRFDNSGVAVGSEFQINTYTTQSQRCPQIAIAADGGSLVTWESTAWENNGQDGSRSGIFAQQFDSGGNALGSEFQVNTYTSQNQDYPEVAMDDAGNFVIVWESSGLDGSGSGVFAQRYRSPCSADYALTAGQWAMISLSCDPGTSNTVADVLGDDLTGTYDWDWVVYERDESSGYYTKLQLTSPLEMGVGYWIATVNSGETINVEGLSPYVTEVPLVASASGVQNLVGHPFDFNVCWRDVRVIDGGSVLTLDQADPAGECEKAEPGPTCIMARIMQKWGGASYSPYDGSTPGAEGTLASFNAFWVKAFKPGISLRIPVLASTSCDAGKIGDRQAEKSYPGPAGWYVRLIAEAGELRDRGNVFGHLADGADGYDAHDLREQPPSTEPYLTVVFPHPEWKGHAGDYATDFHRSKRRADTWRIAVRASAGIGPVKLRWEGPGTKLRRMRLHDEGNGRTMEMRPDRTYIFGLVEGQRLFTVSTLLDEDNQD